MAVDAGRRLRQGERRVRQFDLAEARVLDGPEHIPFGDVVHLGRLIDDPVCGRRDAGVVQRLDGGFHGLFGEPFLEDGDQLRWISKPAGIRPVPGIVAQIDPASACSQSTTRMADSGMASPVRGGVIKVSLWVAHMRPGKFHNVSPLPP